MSSYSSEEQDSMGEFDFLSGSKVDQYDYAPTEYRHWDSEHYETQMYLEHQRQRLELEDYYPEYSLGRSFAETSRHMTTHDAYPTYDRYDNHDYFRYQDLESDFRSGLNLSKPEMTWDMDFERDLSPYIY